VTDAVRRKTKNVKSKAAKKVVVKKSVKGKKKK
jgi:hypothetical protein